MAQFSFSFCPDFCRTTEHRHYLPPAASKQGTHRTPPAERPPVRMPVRDNIPAIIEKNGETSVTRKLSDKEYEDALTNKLQEEVAELLEAYTAKERSVLDCAEEMADVMEVLYAMGKTCAVSKREVEQVRSQKAAEKGTFSKKIFLVSTGEERREP